MSQQKTLFPSSLMELQIAIIQEPEIPTGSQETFMSCLSSGKEHCKCKLHRHNVRVLWVDLRHIA